MKFPIIIQGRELFYKDIQFIQSLIANNSCWNRQRISIELSKKWNWYTPYGQLKDMACRTLLIKLHRTGLINLPLSQKRNTNSNKKRTIYNTPHDKTPITDSLKDIIPLEILPIKARDKIELFKTYLQKYHYLGLNTIVGENIKYMIFDKYKRPVSCILFGACAWKTTPRDKFIGWDKDTQRNNLQFVVNNSRYLIFPWVKVKCLASYILGKVVKRVSSDWQDKYAHPVYLLETFVQKDKYKGTCYKASNWKYVGDTKGRGKLDVHFKCPVPVKSVWLYPLTGDFQKHLCGKI